MRTRSSNATLLYLRAVRGELVQEVGQPGVGPALRDKALHAVAAPPSRSQRGRTMLRCAKSLSPPVDRRTGKRIRISINEPQFVAGDAGGVLRIGPFAIREQRAFDVPSYDLVRIVR